jgi:hypothetical protein
MTTTALRHEDFRIVGRLGLEVKAPGRYPGGIQSAFSVLLSRQGVLLEDDSIDVATGPFGRCAAIYGRLGWHGCCQSKSAAWSEEKTVVRTTRLATLALPFVLVLLPTMAEAQFRPLYPGYPAYRFVGPESDLRIRVKPEDAAVYIDGYFAGKVAEFNGAFERLHVAPGQHEIVIHLAGYRSLRQKLYLSPDTTRTIDGTLERLPPGETAEPVPTPAERAEPADAPRMRPPRGPAPRPGRADPRGDPGNGDPRERTERDRDPRDRPAPADSRSGALSIRVQPSGSTVLIDGERWAGPADNERLIVQVPEGRHTVEVQRDGFDPFETEVDVRRGQTAPVNISLTRAR